jgi:predicted transposase YbfD/YdcC
MWTNDTREIRGKITTETVYLITSLKAAEASPERLLELNRAHWGIENKLRHVRDVSVDEDRCRVHSGARVLSGVRNAALEIIHRSGPAIRAARENFREDRAKAIKAVTGRIL